MNSSPNGTTGGRVWATADATAGIPAFTDVTNNGPQGNINPNQFPVSGVAMDSSDATGGTVYVTVMGFTGGPGHVWKSTNFGAGWIDYTANLPDSPVNAVVVFPALSQIYVATDVGVFSSSTSTANWTEVGPIPGVSSSGYLPNVAVTALGVFNSGGQQLLRVSTYGRGVWQFNLAATPDFQISLTNSPQTISLGATATFQGSISALDGYSGTVTVSCVAGATPAPSTCTPSATPVTAGNNLYGHCRRGCWRLLFQCTGRRFRCESHDAPGGSNATYSRQFRAQRDRIVPNRECRQQHYERPD